MSGEMGKPKQRQAANTANAIEAKTLSVNERILKDVFELYADGKKGLVEAARTVGLTLLPPRKKITILLIGTLSKRWGWLIALVNAYIVCMFVNADVVVDCYLFVVLGCFCFW